MLLMRQHGGYMKKLLFKIIMIVYVFLWLILSAVSYLGVYPQINKSFMDIFVWSFLLTAAYLLVLYAGSLLVTRFYLILIYRKIKAKYLDIPSMMKQILLLTTAILFIYGLCSQAAYYIGLTPIMLFFYKKFLQVGKFYVYHNGRLIYLDDKSREYTVKCINTYENKTAIQIMKGSSTRTVVLNQEKYRRETQFLKTQYVNVNDSKEVA
jgi:hypothetical protein